MNIMMVRADLDSIPQHPLPEGYRMQPFGKAARDRWVRIQQASETHAGITRRTFDVDFGADLPAAARRGLFLVGPDGQDAGTITAWYTHSYRRRRWGRIHWVAVMPDHRGKGLSKAMMTVAMNHLKQFGHRRVCLRTQTFRTIAVKVYLDFGFRPDLTYEDGPRAWSMVRQTLAHPALKTL